MRRFDFYEALNSDDKLSGFGDRSECPPESLVAGKSEGADSPLRMEQSQSQLLNSTALGVLALETRDSSIWEVEAGGGEVELRDQELKARLVP